MNIKKYFERLAPINILMVTRKTNLTLTCKHYLAASIHSLRLLLLTKEDMESDSSSNRRFLDSTLYFRAEDDRLFKISYEKYSSKDHGWILEFKLKAERSTTLHLTTGFMHYAFIETGKRFFFGEFSSEKITEIVLVTNEPLEEYKNFQEAKLVTEFNS